MMVLKKQKEKQLNLKLTKLSKISM